MRYLDEFSNPKIAKKILAAITELAEREIVLMEVCGTHTVAIFRHGIRRLLPPSIKLLSGPGCPVCVTPTSEIDRAIFISREKDVILTTFGDMMRVPGRRSSLEKEKAEGANIKVVYSVLDGLEIAKTNPQKRVVFFGVGFETTSPSIAVALKLAKKERIKNFFLLSCHKIIPPAMKALLTLGEVKLNGFICPGHVSTIIGSYPYEFIAKEFHLSCVISGFEPLDILQSIYLLVKQVKEKRAEIEIQYRRSVKPDGNKKAQAILAEVFQVVDSEWRGIGVIPQSGLGIREEYREFDASLQFEAPPVETQAGFSQCICGEILRGVATPLDCPLFKKTCTPENPIGPCMVSSEGSCSAYYKYGG